MKILKILTPALFFFLGTLAAQPIYDESKVPAYELPDLLTSDGGQSIEDQSDWMDIRRPEILQKFNDFVYGAYPLNIVQTVVARVDVATEALDGMAIRKQITIHFVHEGDTADMSVLVYLPKADPNPTPIFLGLNFYGNHTVHVDSGIDITNHYVRNNNDLQIFNNRATERSRGLRAHRWPVELILERGYGLATIYYGDLDPDYDDNFENGIHGILGDQRRRHELAFSGISAWAAGLSVAMDYFETDHDIDHDRVSLLGHSRLGKAALWAGAMDQRFAIVISNNSGCGGAALSRRKYGETVRQINERFPHWFCKRFHNFNDKENELPVDQHMLLALLAPRPVYVASAEDDRWADPTGEYQSLVHAGPAYRLFGFDVIQNNDLPTTNVRRWSGQMGYHIRSGPHDITEWDWEQYLDFADIHVGQRGLKGLKR